MQMYTLTMTSLQANIEALKEVLDAIAVPKYFSSTAIDTSGDYPMLLCYSGEEVVMKIGKSTTATQGGVDFWFKLSDGFYKCYNLYSSSSAYASCVANICDADNAIVLYPNASTTYAFPFIICKNNNDDVCVAFIANGIVFNDGVIGMSPFSTSTGAANSAALATIKKSQFILPLGQLTDETQTKLYGSCIYNDDGYAAELWYVSKGCYRTMNRPFKFLIGSTGYVGLSTNSFMIKSN